jgi:O-antigen ligase
MAWTVFAMLAGLLAIWISIRGLIRKQAVRVPFKWIWFPASLFVGVCFWALIQSLSFTPEGLHHPLWSVAAEALGQRIPGAISVNPHATGTALLRLMTYGMVFWLALQLGRESWQADLILHAITFAISAYALYALILWSAGSDTILWYAKWANRGRLSSTFVNPNNFATFAGLGCIASLGLLVRSLRGGVRRGEGDQVKYMITRFVRMVSGRSGIYLLSLIVPLGALFLSASRGGFLATLFAMSVLIAFNLLKERPGIVNLVVTFVLAAVVFVFVFDLGGVYLADRFQQNELQAGYRLALYKQTLRGILDSPWLGTGYGTFRDVFPMYRDGGITSWGVIDLAHNTYLEDLLELGVPAALALFVAIGASVWLCFRGVLRRRRGRHFPLVGFAVSVLVAVHSLVDFSLQIPGVAITYVALLGIGVAQSWSSRKR